ncbi:sensor domain-containing diguanylate cyclase [Motiliproteus sp. SC1-56]|uniref:GGDEF domain-containing protein n=1 Tax=Motiliproteus sp. SC1-56 TaxID=2799565 RepID=UPI001A8ED28A|nr:sensor domain-containing diguanylate cyclase [Motiliproteus sp. SC1-56]
MTLQTLLQANLAAICPDPIIAVDRAGIIVFFNDAAEQLLEYRADEVMGKLHIQDLYHPSRAGRIVKRMMYSPEYGGKGRIQGHESALISKHGRIIPIQISAALIMEDGREVGSIGFFHDLSRRKQMENSLRKLSITDNLTGLHNQRHFYAVLKQEMARSARYNQPLSLVCADMDNFKQVNDSLGHQVGDSLIAFLGAMIREELRSSDFGFRYGGDEFMILLPQTGLPKSRALADRLRQRFHQEAPEVVSGLDRSLPPLSLSIGVVDFKPGTSSELFIREADMAMYQAKSGGGNQVALSESPRPSQPPPHH